MDAPVPLRLRPVTRAAWTCVRRAPGTYIWLGVLLVTSVVTRRLPAGDLEVLLGNRSTNLHHPAEDPVRVLVSSAF